MSDEREREVERVKEDLVRALKSVVGEGDLGGNSQSRLDAIKLEFLAKKGKIPDLMRRLAQIDAAKRPAFGKLINQVKEHAEQQIAEIQKALTKQLQTQQLAKEQIDVTLPGRIPQIGLAHPGQALIDRALDVLTEMGFTLQQAPEIDTEFYMFDALNFPRDHPARDMQDTFYLEDNLVLRSHTTNAQVRWLEAFGAPLRAAVAGKVFRNEEVSARSLVTFHQIDVLVVAQDVTYGDLIDHLELFFARFLDRKVELRTRLSYFPFVQPGIEVDVRCPLCPGTGCSACKQSGWIEVCGAGMVHPHVLASGGIDSEKFAGFAWGMGVERLVMLAFGIRDIRQLVQNETHFLRQFHKL